MKLNCSKNPFGFRKAIILLLLSGAAILLISPVFAGTGVTISADGNQSYYLGENVVLRGLSPDADTVYLFLTGPNLQATGVNLTAPSKAVTSGNPDSFTVVKTKPDKTWEYSLYTANLPLDAGVYNIFAVSQPKAKDQLGPGAANVDFILKRPFTGVTISADGDQSYYLGEKVVLRGLSPDADTVYLFLTGPNLQATGVNLTAPSKAVTSGNPDSFTVVKTKPDKTWEYAFYTANLKLDAGTYTLFALSQPKAKDQLGPGAANVGMALKKPYITANISSSNVVKGEPLTVTGIAEGIPPEVQIWVIGDNYAHTTKTPVNSATALFTFTADAAMSGKLPTGQNYIIVQHPMADNQFDFVVSEEYVRNLKLNNGTNLFKITGPGSLQGCDAADALIAAISNQEAHDKTLTNDTYTLIPFQVTDTGSSSTAGTGVTISAVGDKSYYLGEKVVFSGQNTDSDSTYLFITGPDLPAEGVKLASPKNAVVSGSPDTFTVVKTNPDKTWDYSYYTANLPFQAGTYTVYAASQPKTANQLGTDAANVGIILKKPFISAGISASSISKGQPFTVTGVAEGIPSEVQIWVFGDNYAFMTKTPVNSDGDFTFTADAAMSENLPAGQYYLVVQHPMADNQFDFVVSGDYVRDVKLNNSPILFRLTGSGNLRGSDAADALITSITAQNTNDDTLTNDTYTLIPFTVTTSAGPTSAAGSGVTISADGTQSYYLGEKVVFRGRNTDSDSIYLFLTGPNLQATGVKLTSPKEAAVSGNPDTFTIAKTNADKSWEYSFYTANLLLDAGTYTVYAASQPKTADQLGPDAANVGIVLKKPFITAALSPTPVAKGEPFKVTGTAVGNIPEVQIWIIGDKYVYTTTTPVNSDANFTFIADAALSGNLPAGQNYLFVQHPMQNNEFDIDISGDYVRNMKLNNGTNLFKINGTGSLQGSDAADALMAAFTSTEARDDTFTVIPFQVTGAESQTPQTTIANTLRSLETALRSLF